MRQRSITKVIRDWIKVVYYNLRQPNYKFRLVNKYYKTLGENWSIKTYTPLYFITKEIDRYERFYSVMPNDVVVDAGAFHGILSLVYLKKARIGKVYSFEPDNINQKHLRANLTLNNNPKNIQIIEKGLWDEQSYINFMKMGV